MKLMTKELENRFKEVGCQEKKSPEETIVVAHYFIANCDWWVTEYLPEDRLFFGFACLGDPEMAELGYVSLDELETTKIKGIFSIERDLYWDEKSLKEVMDAVKGIR